MSEPTTPAPAHHRLRLARVYDGRDQTGRPVVDRPPLDPQLHEALLAYLESAPVILAARSLDLDDDVRLRSDANVDCPAHRGWAPSPRCNQPGCLRRRRHSRAEPGQTGRLRCVCCSVPERMPFSHDLQAASVGDDVRDRGLGEVVERFRKEASSSSSTFFLRDRPCSAPSSRCRRHSWLITGMGVASSFIAMSSGFHRPSLPSER